VCAVALYGDPDRLDELARVLRARADVVREHATDHVRQGQAAHWVSAAATTYRERVHQDAAKAEHAAETMEKAASLLCAHADEVREKLALIARYEHEATAWFESQARSVADRVDSLVDEVGHLLKRVVTEPPWSGWPIGPLSLPATGDMRWLEVGAFMRGQGAI
jgi:DNA anti-recombination protein RmuC